MEKHNLRQRGLDLIRKKMELHSDKMKDIFETHVERPESDSEGEEIALPKDRYVVRISRLGRVLGDIGAFVGIAFNTFNSFLSNLHDTRKTESGVVKQIQKYMWEHNHKERIEEQRRNPTLEEGAKVYKKRLESILKPAPSRPTTVKTVSSDSAKSLAAHETAIRWEDELFKREKKEISLTADQFMRWIVTFYEENEEILIFDHQKEFDKELDQNFKEETDATFDPFREQIEETLKVYQEMLMTDEFKSESEKQATQKIVKDLQRQLDELDRLKLDTKTMDDVKSMPIGTTIDS